MSLVEWHDDLSVKIGSIDHEHKQLIGLVNELHEGVLAGEVREDLLRKFDALVTYTSVHFMHEEGYFERTGYPDAEEHRQEHEKLLKEICGIQKKLKSGDEENLSPQIISFLENWLMDHVQGSDMKYSDHLIANGIR